MSQLLRNLLTINSIANRALTHGFKFSNPQNHLTKLVTNRIYSPISSFKSSLVTNTFPQNSAEFKVKRNYDHLDEEHRPTKFGQHFINKRENDKQFSRFNRTRFNDKPRNKTIQRDFDHDIEGDEPVESTGKASDYTTSSNSFDQFNLPKQLLDRLNELGYNKPFEIQEKTLQHTLEGRDVVGKAFTGSGKTLAFSIPIIAKIYNNPNKESKYPKCLVLSPTRELCLQLQKSIQELAPELKCLAIYGGTDYESQIVPLRNKVDIVCATPGRLRDLMNRKNFVADEIEIICLDEADELLTPNFIEQIKEVIEISNKKQMLMFSATLNKNVAGLVRKYMHEPVFVDLTQGQKYKLPVNIQHHFIKAKNCDIASLVAHYLTEFQMDKCIVFTNMKREAIKYNYILNGKGIRSSDLHSDLSQRRRQIIIDKFRRGKIQVLVATDVAARGLDIPEINIVINLGFPPNGIDYYIHRSGRTGRAGRVGNSILIDDGTTNIDSEIFKIIKFNRLTVPDSVKSSGTSSASSNDEDSVNKDFYDGEDDEIDFKPTSGYKKYYKNENFRTFKKPFNSRFNSSYDRKRNFNERFDSD